MKKASSVKLNVIMNFILTISNFIFPLITFPYAARILGANGVGVVTFASSIISYFSMVGMLGIPTYAIRACAKIRDDQKKLEKTVQEIMLLNLIVMSIALLALVVSVLSIERLNQEKTLYLILSSTLIFNVLGADWLYRGLERYAYITMRSIVFKFLGLALLFLLVKTSDDYIFYGAISVFASVGSNVLNFINLRKIVSLKPTEKLNLRQHIKPSLTFFLLSVATTIYLSIDTTLLGFLKGNEVVGYYSASLKPKQVLIGVVTSIGAVLLPRLSHYYDNGKYDEFKQMLQKSINFIFVLAIPLVVYFILFAKETIIFLSGDSFLPAVLPMQLLMPTVLFVGLSNLTGYQILMPTNRELIMVYSTIVGAVVDVIVNLLFIPSYGAVATGLASSTAELTVFLVQAYVLREMILPMLKESSLVKVVLAVVLATTVTMVLYPFLSLGSVFVTLVVTGLIFFAVYGVLLLLARESFVASTTQHYLSKLKQKKG